MESFARHMKQGTIQVQLAYFNKCNDVLLQLGEIRRSLQTLWVFPLLFLSTALSGISALLGFEARPIDEGTRSSLGIAFLITPGLSRSPRTMGLA